ncbi:hypothetical protein G6F65_017446 [Rhizopus arrhizus]|nr:hypothetical protein G6F65_017446 [Rhizopus arrhizus]
MTVAKVIEITASSPKSVEDAVRSGLKKVSETVKGIQGAWVNETKVVTNGSGEITEWRVNLRVTFLVDTARSAPAAAGSCRAGPAVPPVDSVPAASASAAPPRSRVAAGTTGGGRAATAPGSRGPAPG